MNWRRCMCPLRTHRQQGLKPSTLPPGGEWQTGPMSALGHKQTCAPQADMCSAPAHVCFGPKADSCIATNDLFDHLVAKLQKCVSERQPERFGLLDIDDKFKLIRRLCRQIASRLTLEDTIYI